MGMTRWGIPKETVLKLSEQFNIDGFIETGTYKGETSLWASHHFNCVTTVEASRELYSAAKTKLSNNNKINLIFGNSKDALREIVKSLRGPALFWLDAHYSGGQTFGSTDECPLIEELNEINSSKHDHFVLIDDARLFLSPPYLGHDCSQWPAIDEVCSLLQSGNNKKYIAVFDDVIFAVPLKAKGFLQGELQRLNTQTYLQAEKVRTEDKNPFRFFVKRAVSLLG